MGPGRENGQKRPRAYRSLHVASFGLQETMARGPRSVSWQVAWVPSLDRGKLIKVGTQLGLAHPAGGRAQARLWGLSLGGPTPM